MLKNELSVTLNIPEGAEHSVWFSQIRHSPAQWSHSHLHLTHKHTSQSDEGIVHEAALFKRESSHLCKVSSQSHLAALSQRTQQAGVADEELDGPLCDGFGALVNEVYALEVPEVVRHHSGDETLEFFHVQGAGDVRLVRA